MRNMLIFKRTIQSNISDSLFKGRMVAILGPRQSGKTTLSKLIIKTYGEQSVYFDCQLADVRHCFVLGEPDKLLKLTAGKKIVVFDEAQTIQNIGVILKSFHDTYPEVQIIATGSSSFDLSNKINEPMTGRIFEFTLYPLSIEEIKSAMPLDISELHKLLQFGCYPAVVAAKSIDDKKLILKNIATQYLYKDVFTFEAIRNPQVFENLVKLLALQIGSLVSVNELATQLGVSRSVVQRYMRMLEQAFIIKIIHSFSNNPRVELKKAFKVFFLDLGVRNALVDIETSVPDRKDIGFVFENFAVSEKLKEGSNNNIFPPELLFWRTRTGLEIDIIIKTGPLIKAYECKWGNADVVFTKFLKLYPQSTTAVLRPADFL